MSRSRLYREYKLCHLLLRPVDDSATPGSRVCSQLTTTTDAFASCCGDNAAGQDDDDDDDDDDDADEREDAVCNNPTLNLPMSSLLGND